MQTTTYSLTRSYASQDDVAVGDVVRMREGDVTDNPFATSIVESIAPHAVHTDVTIVTLVRPFVWLHQIGCCAPQLCTAHERYTVPLDMFVERYEVHTTGASQRKDNRMHD